MGTRRRQLPQPLCACSSLPWLPSQHTSAPQQEHHSFLPIQQDGEPEIYVLRDFYVLSRRAAEGKLRHSQKPPSVSLFIRAGKAVYSVSGWKLHWDCSLIVLFVELIALFDRPFSHHAWEWNGFAAMWEWRGLELFLLAASTQRARGAVLGTARGACCRSCCRGWPGRLSILGTGQRQRSVWMYRMLGWPFISFSS